MTKFTPVPLLALAALLWAGACAESSTEPTSPEGGAATADGVDPDASAAAAGDSVAPESDLPAEPEGFSEQHKDAVFITDIEDDKDLKGWIAEHSPEPDVPAETAGGGEPDVSAEADIQAEPPEIVEPEGSTLDAGEGAEDSDTEEPTDAGAADTFFEECEVLGIAESWAGTFLGEIYYNLDTGGAVDIEEGILPIGGGLSFEISCINSKLVVNGKLIGSASVEGQGEFPFDIVLSGFFDPATGTLSADLVDGKTVIYDLVEVYFIGHFEGTLQEDGTFDGTWDAEATGTNQAFIQGTGEGQGTWVASEVPGG